MSAITASLKSAEKFGVPLAIAGTIMLIVAVTALPRYNMSRPATQRGMADQTRQYVAAQSETQVLDENAPVPLASVGQIAPARKNTETASSGATADRKLVRTGSLELTVKSPAEAAEQIRRLAESMGGYLESAQIGGSKEAPTADITIRVPAARFEDVKAQIRGLASRVESEKTDAQDVTRQYVDMEARLRNLRAEEAQYLTILKSAYKVEDMVQVTEKLSEVRGEIEQQQAEFQTLSKQVETVAITISLRAFADAQVFGLNWRPLYQLKVALRNGLEALGDYAAAMVAIMFYVPVILAWGLTILLAAVLAWRLFRWTARRFFAWPAVSEKPAA